MISESIELSQSVEIKELQMQADEQSEFYPLGPSIALTYVSVLEDCVSHCMKEGLEVKRLGGLHVIGTSLHESRRIDNQVSCSLVGLSRRKDLTLLLRKYKYKVMLAFGLLKCLFMLGKKF